MNAIASISSFGQVTVLVLVAFLAPAEGKTAVCEQYAKSVGDFIPVEELGEWDVIDDQTLLIWVPGSARAHLVRLSKPLPMLQETEELSVVGGGREHIILPCGRDVIEIDDDPQARAAITEIEPLSEARAAELLARTTSAIAT